MATKVRSALVALFAVAASAVGLAAPASADSSAFLEKLQPRYAFMSQSQLMDAGNKACSATRSGVPASDITVMLSKEFGISTSAAYEITVNAFNYLGC